MTGELSPIDVPSLLRRFGLRPKKGLGQNFLVDGVALQKVLEAGEISEGDTVLEIGPGLGGLTRLLASRAKQVIAVELDERFFGPLGIVLAGYENITLIQGDILALQLDQIIPAGPYRVVANIPYYITSVLIRHLLEAKNSPDLLALTVQVEVAERICADPPKMNLLGLSVQVYGRARVAARIPARAFYPPPKIDSAVVRVDRYASPLIPVDLLDLFFKMAKAGFGKKRKMLRNSISSGMGWDRNWVGEVFSSADIDFNRRAETLTLKEWEILARVFRAALPGSERS